MKTHSAESRREGFTLLEILIVISIIAVLAALAIPAADGVTRRARALQATAAIRDVVTGLKQYQVDYGRFPVPAGRATEDMLDLDSGSAVLKVLLGENPQRLNPKAERYIEPKIGQAGAGGLIGAGDDYSLVDPWGQPYHVVLDLNYDGRLANPDAQNEDAEIAGEALAQLPVSVLVFSSGPDKKLYTRDDVVSWR
jgi:prepilin-type N-terminal cleavage/methylation domain-containing protein